MDRVRRFRRWHLSLVLVVVVGAVLAVFGPPLARQVGAYLITADPLEPVDAIVVLAAYSPDRAIEAADLFRQGYAPRIVFSTEEQQSGTAYDLLDSLGVVLPESHELMASIARQLSVPDSAILIADIRGNSTRAEATKLLSYLKRNGIHSIIAVSSKSHTNRVCKIFRRVFGDEIRVLVHPSRYDEFDPDAWWRTRWQARSVLLEYLKYLDYYWEVIAGTPVEP